MWDLWVAFVTGRSRSFEIFTNTISVKLHHACKNEFIITGLYFIITFYNIFFFCYSKFHYCTDYDDDDDDDSKF